MLYFLIYLFIVYSCNKNVRMLNVVIYSAESKVDERTDVQPQVDPWPFQKETCSLHVVENIFPSHLANHQKVSSYGGRANLMGSLTDLKGLGPSMGLGRSVLVAGGIDTACLSHFLSSTNNSPVKQHSALFQTTKSALLPPLPQGCPISSASVKKWVC